MNPLIIAGAIGAGWLVIRRIPVIRNSNNKVTTGWIYAKMLEGYQGNRMKAILAFNMFLLGPIGVILLFILPASVPHNVGIASPQSEYLTDFLGSFIPPMVGILAYPIYKTWRRVSRSSKRVRMITWMRGE